MRSAGVWLLMLGIGICAFALFAMGTTVAETSTYNLGLLQDQLLVFIGGSAIFVAGAAVTAAGVVLEAIAPPAQPAGTKPADATPAVAAAPPPPAPVYETEAGPNNDLKIVFWTIGVLIVVIVLGYTFSNASRAQYDRANVTAIDTSVDALADNMEAQADRIDAIAGNLTATGR